MNQRIRDYLIIIGLLLVFIYVPFFLRDQPFANTDDYYFANYVFHNTDNLEVTNSVTTKLFSMIPESILVIKTLMFLFSATALLIFYEVCRIRFKKFAIWGSIILMGFSFYNIILYRFEDDLFALPFLFVSLFFVTKYQLADTRSKYFDKNIFLAIIFLIASTILWEYSILIIILYLFMTSFHYLIVLAGIFLSSFIPQMVSLLTPSFKVTENYPFVSVFVLAILGFAYIKKARISENWLGVIVFSCLTLINYKLIFLLIPILVLNIVQLIEISTKQQRNIVFFVFALFLLASPYIILTSFPTNKEYQLLELGKSTANDLNKPIEIDWSLGYYAIWNGIPTDHYGHVQDNNNSGVVLVAISSNKSVNDCNIIKENKWIKVADCQ